ncbi:MAG: protein-L-isoaspartate(D-aspartate) O-methyltransferase [Deltaproteobacteria bacterium]|nr:protein-L-isoaspartate(D-aspartate) O-methyltransferase [Deltaproteobacteria bacterium]
MSQADDPVLVEQRRRMVATQLRNRDIDDQRVLTAFERVPRHRFVPPEFLDEAYADRPLPIGHGQTISQPYIVALTTQLARPRAAMKVLDVGTGSGYQAALLAELVERVCTIEIVAPLASAAATLLAELGYRNVEVRCGDGSRGWPEQAPFDAIVAAAAPAEIPPALIEQLAVGGRLVIPLGTWWQELVVAEKRPDGGVTRHSACAVRYVPMVVGS